MAVPILQTLVGLIFVLLGMVMAGKPPTTKKEQWLCRSIFIFLGLLLLALSWIQFRNEQKKEAALSQKIQALNTSQAVAQPPAENATVMVDGNQSKLEHRYQNLVRELATNSSLAPDVRERIIIATAKLDRDAQALEQMPSAEAVNAAQAAKDKILPYFEYTVVTLATLSEKEAGLKGDKSVLVYPGLPDDLSADAKAGKRSRKNVAEIKFQANAAWDFQINFAEVVTPKYKTSLSVSCKGGLLVLKNAGDSIETKVEMVSGESIGHEAASGDEARANIAAALQKLAASESDAVEAK